MLEHIFDEVDYDKVIIFVKSRIKDEVMIFY